MTPCPFRRAVAMLALAVALASVTPRANAQATAPPADERLRALYSEEWTWRQQEFGRRGPGPGDGAAADRLPRVDAASQAARLAYWTNALATLDTIPFDAL